MAVDDVDADKQQSTLAQRRAEARADFTSASHQVDGLRGSAADAKPKRRFQSMGYQPIDLIERIW
jgi:hypothetical protein